MTLNDAQRKQVEENMGLVGKVIKDRVHGMNGLGIYTYDDLFQIGCIGLCKAAATDKGGCFSTYAYRLIWNEICTALISATRKASAEQPVELPILEMMSTYEAEIVPEQSDNTLTALLDEAERSAAGVTAKGIRALRLMADGYTAREIGEQMGASANNVTAWVSRARRYLREMPELRALIG